MGTALGVKLFDRGGDFRGNGSFGDGGENGVGDDVLRDGLDLGGGGFDGDGGGWGWFFPGAAGGEQKDQREAGELRAKSY